MKGNGRYLTQIIQDDYLSWKPGESILLCSGTNTGKTTFIFTLANHCEKCNRRILYLVSRISKLEEINEEIKFRSEEDGIDYKKFIIPITYQKLEAVIGNNSKELSIYISCEYIFADECHYFVDDSSIEDSCSEVSMKFILGSKYSIKIYASATADTLYKALIKKFKIPEDRVYYIDKSYDYVNSLYIYRKEDTIKIIDWILRNEIDSKILVYVISTEQMLIFYETYGDQADYLCARNTSDKILAKICNLKSGEQVEINKRILFATKTLDVGVNIIDPQLKHIMCQLYDINTVVQCFGRKRPIDNNDTCTFYLEDKTAKNLVFRRNTIQKHLDLYKEYKENREIFEKKYKDNRLLNKNGSVFEWTKKQGLFVNYARLQNYKEWMEFYDNVKEYGYMEAVASKLDKGLREKMQKYHLPEDPFLNRLRSFESKMLFAEDRKIIQSIIKEQMTKSKQTRKTYGLKTINDFLDENYGDSYESRFSSFRDRRKVLEDGSENPNFEKTYWILE